jgi:amino acid permease
MTLLRLPGKQWHEMTGFEIIVSLVGMTAVWGVVVTACIRRLVVQPLGKTAIFPTLCIVVILLVVGSSYVAAIRELRRRN